MYDRFHNEYQNRSKSSMLPLSRREPPIARPLTNGCNPLRDEAKTQNLHVTWTARRLENLNSTRSPSRWSEARRWFGRDIPALASSATRRSKARDDHTQSGPRSLESPPRRGTAAAWVIAKCGEEKDWDGRTKAGDRRTTR